MIAEERPGRSGSGEPKMRSNGWVVRKESTKTLLRHSSTLRDLTVPTKRFQGASLTRSVATLGQRAWSVSLTGGAKVLPPQVKFVYWCWAMQVSLRLRSFCAVKCRALTETLSLIVLSLLPQRICGVFGRFPKWLAFLWKCTNFIERKGALERFSARRVTCILCCCASSALRDLCLFSSWRDEDTETCFQLIILFVQVLEKHPLFTWLSMRRE